jgi:hypothetical protein
MSSTLAVPERFFRDLDSVSSTLGQTSRCDEFLRDLDRIHPAVAAEARRSQPISDRDLAELEDALGQVHEKTLNDIGGANWRGKLPDYDPLLSPISLFGSGFPIASGRGMG